ncbi:hypothetical protein [Mycoplasma sp. P36-A1]|uniref:hypothetical protein n=1 Tax=Mycoplasma sp. P36-A1 TaxID=3252900 RepID=UPI003C2F055B
MKSDYMIYKVEQILEEINENPPSWFLDNIKTQLDSNITNDELINIINEIHNKNLEIIDEELTIKYINTDLLEKIKEIGIKAGEYEPGTIKENEYYILALSEDVYLDLVKNNNELFDSRMIYSYGYVYIKKDFKVMLEGGLLLTLDQIKDLGYNSGKELYESLNPQHDIKEAMYKVGYDIEEGLYVVGDEEDMNGFVEIYNGPIGVEEEYNEIIDEQQKINLYKNQYVQYFDGYFKKIN